MPIKMRVKTRVAHSSTLGSLMDSMGSRYPVYLFSECTAYWAWLEAKNRYNCR